DAEREVVEVEVEVDDARGVRQPEARGRAAHAAEDDVAAAGPRRVVEREIDGAALRGLERRRTRGQRRPLEADALDPRVPVVRVARVLVRQPEGRLVARVDLDAAV